MNRGQSGSGAGRRSSLPRRRFLGGGLATATAAFLAACGGGGEKSSSSGGAGSGGAAPGIAATGNTPAAVAAVSTATLRAGIGSDVGSMDPQSLAGTGGGNWPNYALHFAALTWIDTQNSVTSPWLAESFKWIEPGKVGEAKLREGLTFHNGDPITADDVKFTFDRAQGKAAYNPQYKTGAAGQFRVLGETSVVDARTVRWTLTQPDVIFWNRVASLVNAPLMPKKYIEKVGDEEFARNPVGAGPFKFVSRVADSEIRSERFDNYYVKLDNKEMRPRMPVVKSVIQKIIPENQARVAALQAGEVDLIHNVSSDLARQLESGGQFQVLYLPGDQPMRIEINSVLERDPASGKPNPWRDKRVREAANNAIDLDTIIKKILTGKEQPSFGSSSSGFGFPADLPAKRFKYDVQKAKQLLAAAGYADGFEAPITNPTGRWPNSREVSEAVSGYLAAVGIKAPVQETQYQVVTTKFKDDSMYPLCFWGQAGGPDPAANFRFSYHSTGDFKITWNDPDLDRKIEAQEQEFDTEKRKKMVEDVIRHYYEDAAAIFLYAPVTVVVMSKKWKWAPAEKVLSVPEYWNIVPA